MRQFAGVTVSLWLALAGGAIAQETDNVVVVELYTSQGCSSCPPADEFLTTLLGHSDVLPLALHVDYWDYIGWADKFADAAFTARQKSYARAINSRTIYTPQMIVGGTDRVEGNRPDEVVALIKRHGGVSHGVTLTLARSGEAMRIDAEAGRALKGPVTIQLVRYRPEETVAIERGENAGRTLTYHNIVTSWQALGEWSGKEPLAIEASVPGPDPAVVILQEAGPGAILAAARAK